MNSVIIIGKRIAKEKNDKVEKFDYSRTGAYFLTICVEGRKTILSEIIKSNHTAINETKNQSLVGEPLAAPENEKSSFLITDEEFTLFANRYSVALTSIGEVVKEQLLDLENRYGNVKIKNYVIMPDHIHIILYLRKATGAASGSPTVNDVVRAFKSRTSCKCRQQFGIEKIFQRSFTDHIIRDREDYDVRMKYISENPIRWYYNKTRNS